MVGKEQREYIVAIDLGTFKIAAVAGVKDALGFITVLAVEQEPSGGCIRRGCIYNVEEAAAKVKNVIAKLESKLSPNKIAKVYVGIGGQSLRSVNHRVSLDLDGENTVTNAIIQSLYKEAKQYTPELLELLDAVHPRYEINGGKAEQNPLGVLASEITADYKMIVARPSLKRNIIKVVTEKAGYQVAECFISPLALANFVLTEPEKDLGCALIDFGAGTTTLSIYKGGSLRHLIVIPFGGQAITKDITHLNIVESEAEQLKIRYGRVGGTSDQIDQTVGLGNGGQELKLSELNMVIEVREAEIIENIINQIKLSGFYQALGAGIVLAGEAASMRGLAIALGAKAGCEVRMADSRRIQSTGSSSEVHSQTYLQALSLMAMGKENCAAEIKEPAPPPTPTPKPAGGKTKKDKGNFFGKLTGNIGSKITNVANGLFDNIDAEDSE